MSAEAAELFAALGPQAPVGVVVQDDGREVLRSPALAGVDLAAPDGPWRAIAVSLAPPLAGTVAVDASEEAAAAARLERAERLAGLGSYAWDAARDAWTWSAQLFRLAGLDPVGDPPDWEAWVRSVAPGSRDAVLAANRAAIRERRPFDLHLRQRLPDGGRRILRARGGPVPGDDGRVAAVTGFAQDVTELKGAEERQRAVAELGRAALSGLALDPLMTRAAEVAAEALELDHVSVLEVQPGGGLVLRAGVGWPPGQIGTREARSGRGSYSGFTLLAGGPVVVEDWAAERRFAQPEVLSAAGVRSSACVIVGDPAAPYGTLAAHSRRAGRVAHDHVPFLRSLADVLARAVTRLRTEQELAAQAAARGRLVAQALDAEDRTRRAISEALHDGPLQDLLAVHQALARLEAPGEHLDRARAGVAEAIRRVREAMVDLHPVTLEVAGLESALEAIAERQGRRGGFAWEVTVDPAAQGVQDDLVVALARELLTNAAKHAHAGRVRVAVRRTPEGVALEVADDGAGIPAGRLRTALGEGHIGLASSTGRVEAVGGRLVVAPAPGGGTRASALLPA